MDKTQISPISSFQSAFVSPFTDCRPRLSTKIKEASGGKKGLAITKTHT